MVLIKISNGSHRSFEQRRNSYICMIVNFGKLNLICRLEDNKIFEDILGMRESPGGKSNRK